MKKVIEGSKDFADFLRMERQAQFMTQLTLAKETGTTQATVCRLESGRQSLHLETMVKIVNRLGYRMVIETPEEDG